MKPHNIRKAGLLILLLAVPLSAGFAAGAEMHSTVALTGRITPATGISRIEAVERNRANVLALSKNQPTNWVFSGKIDPDTGRFSIAAIPTGHTYDLIVFNGKARWEGVNMRYYRPVQPGPPMTRGDLRQIITFIEKIPRFTNYNRPLWIAGDHNHATVVVEQMATKSFYSGHKGSIIFRVAVWYFERYYAGWQKVSNLGKVMTRWRGPAHAMPNPWQYLPALGGIHISRTGKYQAINVTLPKPSSHYGVDGPIIP
ncbi:MAG: hypothetical protein ACP5VQ_01305, partial [Phycisphaerae bacterium]